MFQGFGFLSDRTARFMAVLVIGLATVRASDACAQDRRDGEQGPAMLWEVATRVARDPTTYAPTIVVYTLQRLDWATDAC